MLCRVEWKRADGTKVPGYGFGDMLESKNPGVIVIQGIKHTRNSHRNSISRHVSERLLAFAEWWGITPEIQLQAQKISDEGYRVLVPDLYRGKLGVDAEEAHHLMENLDWAGAIEDISAAADTLDECGNGSVGVVGFCMGGALSLASAQLVEKIDCAVAFYGTPDAGLADMSTLTKPVLGHFGELDPMAGFSDPAAAEALAATLTAAGSDNTVRMYPGVGHAFMNDTEDAIARKELLGQTGGEGGAVHDPAAIDLAWERTLAFFHERLDTRDE